MPACKDRDIVNSIAIVNTDRVTTTLACNVKHIPRYLEAIQVRVDRARHDPAKDKAKAEQASRFVQELENLEEKVTTGTSLEIKTEIEEYRWMVEEFKVSIFAPELKTAHPISSKRLLNKLKAIQEKIQSE